MVVNWNARVAVPFAQPEKLHCLEMAVDPDQPPASFGKISGKLKVELRTMTHIDALFLAPRWAIVDTVHF